MKYTNIMFPVILFYPLIDPGIKLKGKFMPRGF